MASLETQDLVDRFDQFYREYYEDAIAELAQRYPSEDRSLVLDWMDLYRFDEDLADDFRSEPDRLRRHAEEALRLFDLPIDLELERAHIRIRNLPETTPIRDIRSEHVNQLVAIRGIVRKATGVKPRIEEATFECQRCGTLTQIPQEGGAFQEPHQCQGCERQGPFQLDHEDSEFVDAQKLRVQESPEGLRGGQTPESLDIDIEDDITGEVSPGDSVRATGILRLEDQGSGQESSTLFDFYLDGMDIHAEEEQFDEMDITPEDEERIVQLADQPDIYQRMIESIAPSIYGYESAKLAMVLQLFSGVTKKLPDGSRTRGDLHMLLIGDPGTGKCQKYDTKVLLADGRERQLGDLVEENLVDPVEIDDGYYQESDIEVLTVDGSQVQPGKATKVWKREAPDRLYRIRTARGREVEVTPSHPLFVQQDGGLQPVRADELECGQCLAVPGAIDIEPDNGLDVTDRHPQAPNDGGVHPSGEWTPALARFVGYIVAEGHGDVREEPSGDIRITKQDREVLAHVECALDSLGLGWTEPTAQRDEPTCLIRSSSELASFLEQLDPALLDRTAKQRVPEPIFRATDTVRAAFLRAYIEGDGTVAGTEGEISVSSRSEDLLRGVRRLLLTFGIDAQLQSNQPHESDRLRVTGADFDRYLHEIGFVTEGNADAAGSHDGTAGHTNREVIPNLGSFLEEIRTTLALGQFECGVPGTTYQQYERGDRDPSRQSLREVIEAFEERIQELDGFADRLRAERWDAVEPLRTKLNVSQSDITGATEVRQTAISDYGRNPAVPDGGVGQDAIDVLAGRIHGAFGAESDVRKLQQLVESDVSWDRISEIETIEPDDDWVYDLEVAGTHNYIGNGIVSHNSQLLQYIRNIAPRSVYTSGKGSSAAGLCVTGDTLIHTSSGLKPIRDVVTPAIPEPTTEETAVQCEIPLQSFDRQTGEMRSATASHAWRMPPKPCRRLETKKGKSLETSSRTPVLTCASEGIEWKRISEIKQGEHVAVPRFESIHRQKVPIRDFVDLTSATVKLSADSIALLRSEFTRKFGSLRDAAAQLNLSADFIESHLSHRHIPVEKLDRTLEEIGVSRSDVAIDRVMSRDGESITLPETFDDELMYLLGIIFGAGDISIITRDGNRGLVRISNTDRGLLGRAADIFDTHFDKRPEIEEQENRVPCICVNSATVARLFANIGMDSPRNTISLAPELTTAEHTDAFIRGLLDAGGSTSVGDNGGSTIQFSTISERLAEQVQLMLETYGISARLRERDPGDVSTLENGQAIETKRVHYQLDIRGADIDRYATAIGFESSKKAQALQEMRSTDRRWDDQLPIGGALTEVDGPSGEGDLNVHRSNNVGRSQAGATLNDANLGGAAETVREAVEADLRWDEVVAVEDVGEKEVFDLTVPGTHNFVGNGIITHNTAAAVRDEFADGNQWTLEAGALVLADRGIAAIDELDKMSSDDRSALHEGLEAQEISISKAGINATLKARCSLLGAANPEYGRFDPYEPIGEQIDLEPALISRFDLIFTVTDQPDEETDRNLAGHILDANYAGELQTRRDNLAAPEVPDEELEAVSRTVTPDIEPELFQKYVAFAQQYCYPRMTDTAREAIEEFYVDLRSKGADEDAPVPVTARKLEALVRLAEASARIRLSDTVDEQDADRVIEIVRSCLQDIGVDPETGQFDADVVETGRSKTQRERVKSIKEILRNLQGEYDEGVPLEEVLGAAEEAGIEREKAEHQIQKLKDQGEIYTPDPDRLRLV